MKLSTVAITSLLVTLLFGQGQVVLAEKRNSKGGIRQRKTVRQPRRVGILVFEYHSYTYPHDFIVDFIRIVTGRRRP